MASSTRDRSPSGGDGSNPKKRRVVRPARKALLTKADDVVTLLEKRFPGINLQPSVKKKDAKNAIDFSLLMKQVNDLRDKHGTSIEEDYREDALSRVPASLFQQAASATNSAATWHTFMDPANPAELLYAETDEQADALRARGFHEFTQKRLFGAATAASSLPWPASADAPEDAAAAAAAAPAAARAAAAETVPLHERPPPDTLSMPDKIPKIRKEGGPREWIECFEEKVVDEKHKKVYSPIRLWDKSEWSNDSTLNSRLLQYYFAKKGLTVSGSLNLTAVKSAARSHAKNEYGENDTYMKGGNLQYFEICLAIYNEGTGN